MRLCPRKYKFRYVDGLVPKKKDSALMKGKVVHEAFERYFNGTTLEGVLKGILDTFGKALSTCTEEEEEDLILAKYTAYGMIENYPFKDVVFEEIMPEKKFDIRILPMRGARYVGVVDGLVRNHGTWWIREVKTTGSGFGQAERRAGVSSQGTGYIYGISQQEKIPVSGLLYDFISTSRLKKRVSDDATSFGERILEDFRSHMTDPTTGKKLRDSRMYRRYWTYRSPYHLKEFEKDLVKTVQAIRRAKNHNDFVRNTESCYYYNTECPYMKICYLDRLDQEMLNAFYERSGDEKK